MIACIVENSGFGRGLVGAWRALCLSSPCGRSLLNVLIVEMPLRDALLMLILSSFYRNYCGIIAGYVHSMPRAHIITGPVRP